MYNFFNIIVILVSFLSFLISGIKCNSCNKEINGQYYIQGTKKYHETCYKNNIIPKCSQCNQAINGSYIPTDNGKYHENCYNQHIAPKCGVCKNPLSSYYMTDEFGSYHQNCYRNHIIPKCDACNSPLEGQYSVDSWGNNFHTHHKNETGLCSSCSRIVSDLTTNSGVNHVDGRVICNICISTAIDSDNKIENSRKRVLKKLNNIGFKDLSVKIPIILVDRSTLMGLANMGEHVKGLTDYKYQVLKDHNGKIIEKNKDYVIYILDRLPEMVFDAVLAHEYLHVWLFKHDQEYKSSITEGFCNLGSFSVYSDANNQFAKIQLKIMEEDPDPNYGLGYRRMKKCLANDGWSKLISNAQNGKASKCN